jgi:hypothetical protein
MGSNVIMGIGPLALAPMFGDLIEAFHSDLASVVQFTGVCILVLGFSNFFWYGCVPSWTFIICLHDSRLDNAGFPSPIHSEEDPF